MTTKFDIDNYAQLNTDINALFRTGLYSHVAISLFTDEAGTTPYNCPGGFDVTAKKIKKREWIEDYFVQLAAYAMAHNQVYDTKIQSGIILMCSKDCFFQKFEVHDKEFQGYMHQFLRRVDEYYKIVPNVPEKKDAPGTISEQNDQ